MMVYNGYVLLVIMVSNDSPPNHYASSLMIVVGNDYIHGLIMLGVSNDHLQWLVMMVDSLTHRIVQQTQNVLIQAVNTTSPYFDNG